MIIESNGRDFGGLMAWARGRADRYTDRPIRLEVVAEENWTEIIARVYLREPHCEHIERTLYIDRDCECGVLAEKRLT